MNEDKSTRYHRLKRRASAGSVVWTATFLTLMLTSGASRWLQQVSNEAALSFSSGIVASASTVALFTCTLTLLHECGALSFSYYGGLVLERRYGLSNQRVSDWLSDQVKAIALVLVMAIPAAIGVYALMALMPRGWWLPAGLGFALITVGLAYLGPIVLLPLFYKISSIEQETLRERLLALARRANTPVLGVYRWGLGQKTRKANAALTGIGSTRRILVSDTMLGEYSDEEIEVVLAHELAHHVHGDIWTMLVLESALIVGGFYAAARAVEAFGSTLQLTGPGDVASLPLVLLVMGIVSLVALPLSFGVSRAHERRADRRALEWTRNPRAFVTAMRRLAAQNLAEERPSRFVRWFFYSHPPMVERIAAAQQLSDHRRLHTAPRVYN